MTWHIWHEVHEPQPDKIKGVSCHVENDSLIVERHLETAFPLSTLLFSSSSPKQHSKSEMFELIDRLQSSRLDDQRCVLPATLQPAGPNGGGVDPVMACKNSSKNLLRKVTFHRSRF